MANIQNILQSVLQVAQTVTPLLPQGAAAAAAAQAIANLIDDAKAAAGPGNEQTVAELEAVQARVNVLARNTIDGLRGES